LHQPAESSFGTSSCSQRPRPVSKSLAVTLQTSMCAASPQPPRQMRGQPSSQMPTQRMAPRLSEPCLAIGGQAPALQRQRPDGTEPRQDTCTVIVIGADCAQYGYSSVGIPMYVSDRNQNGSERDNQICSIPLSNPTSQFHSILIRFSFGVNPGKIPVNTPHCISRSGYTIRSIIR
jgi:hypothetical protein